MSSAYFRLDRPVAASKADGFTWKTQIIVFFVSILVVISRRPDAILSPQFFAEDGTFWYADAYNTGWFHSLLLSHAGWLQAVPRLAASLSLIVPLAFAPILLNLLAIILQVLPIIVLTSARCRSWAPLNLRMLLAVAYVALPNSRELDAAISQAPWHLALLAALVILAVPSANRIWKFFDAGVVVLSGLTGPFCLALLPLAGAIWFWRRRRWHLVLAGLLAVCGAIQLYTIATAPAAARSQALLGASPTLFLQILAGNVYLAAIFGQNSYLASRSIFLSLIVAIFATTIIAYCLARSKAEFRLFILFCLVIFGVSLCNPLVSVNQPQWQVMSGAPGLRYWFFPMLAFVWATIWCAFAASVKQLRIACGALLVLMIYGAAKDWIYPAYPATTFPVLARQFEALPAGQAMIFPLYPNGWSMQLVKRTFDCPGTPRGILDEPKEGAQVASSVFVRGWVDSTEANPQVEISLDDRKTLPLMENLPRPDVDKLFPGGPVKNKGWQATLNLPPGPHQIQVRAHSPAGCEAVIGTVSVRAGGTP